MIFLYDLRSCKFDNQISFFILAGRNFCKRCEEAVLEKAVCLAGQYELAANVYGRGNLSQNVWLLVPKENFLTLVSNTSTNGNSTLIQLLI